MDPDDEDNMSPLSYRWTCHKGALDSEAADVKTPFDISLCPPSLHHLYEATTGVVVIQTNALVPDDYVIRLKIFKDERVAYYDQTFSVVEGYVPDMSIRYVFSSMDLKFTILYFAITYI